MVNENNNNGGNNGNGFDPLAALLAAYTVALAVAAFVKETQLGRPFNYRPAPRWARDLAGRLERLVEDFGDLAITRSYDLDTPRVRADKELVTALETAVAKAEANGQARVAKFHGRTLAEIKKLFAMGF